MHKMMTIYVVAAAAVGGNRKTQKFITGRMQSCWLRSYRSLYLFRTFNGLNNRSSMSAMQ